jgi:hypothetical protein
MKRKLLAQVPYAPEESFDFYDDRLVINQDTFLYGDIEGYGFLLTNKSQSINFVPISNSTSFELNIFENKQKYTYSKNASNVMLFKNNKQLTVNLIYTELVKCIDAFIAPYVYQRVLKDYEESERIVIGGFTLDGDVMIKKGAFGGQKELNFGYYTGTKIVAGQVKICGPDNKVFYQCSLSQYNAPLAGPILDTIFDRLYER